MTSKDARGKTVSDTGKSVEVWKKQADGKWKTVADIFNSDMPVVQAPAPPAASKTTSRHPHAKKNRHRKARSSETE
jgi:hypothetical protein